MMKGVIVDLRVDNASYLRICSLIVTRWILLRWGASLDFLLYVCTLYAAIALWL